MAALLRTHDENESPRCHQCGKFFARKTDLVVNTCPTLEECSNGFE